MRTSKSTTLSISHNIGCAAPLQSSATSVQNLNWPDERPVRNEEIGQRLEHVIRPESLSRDEDARTMACELVEHQQTSVQDVETSLRRRRLA